MYECMKIDAAGKLVKPLMVSEINSNSKNYGICFRLFVKGF